MVRFEHDGRLYEVQVAGRGLQAQVTLDGQTYPLEVLDEQPGRISLRLLAGPDAGRPFTIDWAEQGSDLWLAMDGCTYRFERPRPRAARKASAGDDGAESVRAPMPAQVREVLVEPGEAVTKGQTLLLLEAMKMEIRVKAPRDGTVARLLVSAGQTVDKEQVLVEIAAHTSTEPATPSNEE